MFLVLWYDATQCTLIALHVQQLKYDVNSNIAKLYRNEGGLVQQVTKGSMLNHFQLITNSPLCAVFNNWTSIPQRGGFILDAEGWIVRYFFI